MDSRLARARCSVAKTELRIAEKLCRGIDTPRALTVKLLIEHGEWQQLVDLRIDPSNYSDAPSFRDDYLVTKFLQKSSSLPLVVDREAVAMSAFLSAEKACEATNSRIEAWIQDPTIADPDVTDVLYRARDLLAKILGPIDKRALSTVESYMDFGPGTTTGLSRVVTRGAKYSERFLTTTSGLLDFGLFCLPAAWRRVVPGFTIRNKSRLKFVPKNAKTDRSICIENDLNIYVQKGIGAYMKDRLRAFGLDLRTQEWNQTLATLGVDWGLTTMDLKSASDTVALGLVTFLLPQDWVELLGWCRSPSVEVTPSETIVLQKWSSMGNGYTFELESAIFYSILLAVTEISGSPSSHLAVYGDDLIFPSEIEDLVSRTLNFAGFEVNDLKTFGKGSFRESCGTDVFEGRVVTPFYMKWNDYESHPDHVAYLYGNAIRSWAHDANRGLGCDIRCLPAWLFAHSLVGPSRRCYVPSRSFGVDKGLSTCGFWANSGDEYQPKRCRNRGGYIFRYWCRPSVERVIDIVGSYTASLQRPSDFSQGREALRGRFLPSKHSTQYSVIWFNPGYWY